jgi:hypothetical protein
MVQSAPSCAAAAVVDSSYVSRTTGAMVLAQQQHCGLQLSADSSSAFAAGQLVISERGVRGGPLAVRYIILVSPTALCQSLARVDLSTEVGDCDVCQHQWL